MMRGLGEWKYLALLAVLVGVTILEPLSLHWTESTQIIWGVVVLMINVPVLLVVFEARWERGVAVCLFTPLVAAHIGHEVFSDRLQLGAIVFHGFAAVFLVWAVAVILQRLFQRQAIRTDEVIGTLCGYLLAAGAWGNAYALVTEGPKGEMVLWGHSLSSSGSLNSI